MARAFVLMRQDSQNNEFKLSVSFCNASVDNKHQKYLFLYSAFLTQRVEIRNALNLWLSMLTVNVFHLNLKRNIHQPRASAISAIYSSEKSNYKSFCCYKT